MKDKKMGENCPPVRRGQAPKNGTRGGTAMIQWKHRLVSLLVCAAMLFSLCPTAAWAEGETTGGDFGSGLHWSLDSAGTLTITGEGAMPDYPLEDPPWYSDRDKIKSVEIGEGVTSVGRRAFDSCTALTSVEFPDTLTAIGEWAFFYCTALTSVRLPEGLETIGEAAFSTCESLASVELPEGLKTIGKKAFWNCASLKEVELPEGLTTIGESAFQNCGTIESVTFTGIEPPKVGSNAFYGTTVGTVYIPYEATDVYESKLSGWGLKNATIMAMLAAPKNLAWDTTTPGTATWSEVNGADSYEVRLYQADSAQEGGRTLASTVTVAADTADTEGESTVSVALAATAAGDYTFTVTAIDEDDENRNSPESAHSGTATFCKVEFDAGNGTPIAKQFVAAGGLVAAPDEPAKDGYTFVGWYTDESLATKWNFAENKVSGNMTLHAKWELKATHIDPIAVRYIIEHYKEDAASETGYTLADTEYSVGKIGTEVTAKPKAYTGFTYNEAESSNSGTLTAISSKDDIVTLKLYYDVTRYAVTVAGSYAEESGAGLYAEGDTVTIHAGTREGYVFSGWTSDDGVTFAKADNETTTFVMPAGAVTVTAVFRALHGVSTERDGQGKVTVSPDDAAEGAQVTVTAEPEDGYRFVEWKGTTVSDGETVDIIFDDPTLPETTFTMPAGAVTVTAVFEKVPPAAPEQAQTGLSDEAAVLLGVGIVATGAAAAAAYYYRDFLPVWKLGGVVKLPDGTPAANAAIELWRDGALVKTLTTDETGAFAARVPKGTYEAAVTWEQDGTAYTARASLTAETTLAPAGPEDLIITPEEAEAPAAPS